MLKLIDEYKRGLYKIKEPILIIHSENDEIIDKKSAEYIYNNVNTTFKSIRLIKNKPHYIIKDDEVLEMTFNFIKNN